MIAIRPGFQPTSAGIRGSRGRGTIIGDAGLITFYSSSFGMVADRFGMSWMVIAGPKNP